MKTILIVLATASVLSVPPQPPEWVHSMAEAQARANTANKPILIYCWADGSDYCTKLYQDTLSADKSAAAMADFVCYSAKHGGDGVQKVFERYGVSTLPTMLFVQPDGKADDLVQGFIPVDDFVGELDRIKSGKGTVSDFEQQLKTAKRGSKQDVEARWQLAGKVQALGEADRHDELMASIRDVDPKGSTLVGARMLMNEIVKDIVGEDGGDHLTDEQQQARVAAWDLAPLYKHAKTVKLAEARHEAWERIGNMEAKKENMQGAFAAFRSAWKTCPEEKVVDWSNDVARWIIKSADDRTSKEKKFALELADAALATLKKRLKDEPPSQDQRVKYRKYEAYCWNTVAWCHHINGKKAKAVKAMKKAITLRESDEYAADLAIMQK